MAGDYKIKVVHQVDEAFCGGVLVTAFDGNYGGSWYWAKPAEEDWLEVKRDVSDDDNVVWMSVLVAEQESEDENGVPSTLHITHEHVMKGLRAVLLGGVIRQDLEDQVRRSVSENEADMDADAADAVVQIGALGSITYG